MARSRSVVGSMAPPPAPPKSTARRDLLQDIEARAQAKWAATKVFEEDAPDGEWDGGKFLVTFPYPYMNGRLHLGHAFSLTKAEFAVAFQRMQGKKALFPFGFHCTGMPIQAAAHKLKNELQTYGSPLPNFPTSPPEVVDNGIDAELGAITIGWRAPTSTGGATLLEYAVQVGACCPTGFCFWARAAVNRWAPLPGKNTPRELDAFSGGHLPAQERMELLRGR